MDSPPEVISLGDLTLRAFDRGADLPELFKVISESQDHLRPWMSWAADHGIEAARDFLRRRAERWTKREAFTYAIVVDGMIVGTCQLFRRSPSERTLEIGYWLHPDATGRGLATRAAQALVREAFLLPDVDCVEIVHDPANRDYAAGFAAALMAKDLGLAAGAAEAAGLPTELGRRAAQPYADFAAGEARAWTSRRSSPP
ncbi:GNAT family N-acetyltransferase [Kitasatospora sp. NPDC086801]|uniref:GNAT family N-acetyltransferase n=1 Tax=Kitasatospora sp. NPDC086801 TaxID=3364066 RepID=UPI003830EE7A